MTHKIPYGGWAQALADVIDAAADGDTVECHSAAMVEIGEGALASSWPDKKVTFVLEGDAA